MLAVTEYGTVELVLGVVAGVFAFLFICMWIGTIVRLYIFLGKAEDRHVSILKYLQSINKKLAQAKAKEPVEIDDDLL